MDWISWWCAVLLAAPFAAAPATHGAALLHELDRTRAEAFTTGDAALLSEVYPHGSTLLEADTELLRDYLDRGMTLRGGRLQLLEAEVLSDGADEIVLDIVERLGPTRVVLHDGGSTMLPRDLPSRRQVTMRSTAEGWRIVDVRAS